MSQVRRSNDDVPPQIGEAFIPYKRFTGSIVPEQLCRSKLLSHGEKLAWGRLARYAGKNGQCHPSMKALGAELGVGERQAQKYVDKLVRLRLIRRIKRFDGHRQTTNAYEFLWHEIFETPSNKCSPPTAHDQSCSGANDRSHKESHEKENHNEENKPDLDYPPAKRKKRASQAGTPLSSSQCKQFPDLREALADYMTSANDTERVYPNDHLVVDVMNLALGATEAEVVEYLRHLRDDHGLKFGTKHGPRRFAWFKTVVHRYFQEKRASALPPSVPPLLPP